MSRSIKKFAIIKDKGNEFYNRTIRRKNKEKIKKDTKHIKDVTELNIVEEVDLLNPREIINDYDIMDYKYIANNSPLNRKWKNKNVQKEYRK
jgi:hypothetical protein